MLRTFSKIYGLAGLRVGYGDRAEGRRCRDEQGAARVRRDRDGTGGSAREHRRRRRDRAPAGGERTGSRGLEASRAHARARVAGPALGNFVYIEVGDGRAVFDSCSGKA